MTPAIVLVTAAHALAHVERVVALASAALPSGALVVQLRDKASPKSVLLRNANALRAIGVPLIVNAGSVSVSVAVAREVSAFGVHVACAAEAIAEARSALGDDAWISTPAHSIDDVALARESGATAALVSPIFATPGKGTPRGIEAIVEARAKAGKLRVHALGGIDGRRAAPCAVAGADGVAVIRALLDSADPAAEARELAAPFLSR